MNTPTKRRKSSCACINLRRTAGAVSNLYDESLKASGLTTGQYSLLRNISRLGACTVSALAIEVGLERTTLARSLKPLVDKGYVENDAPLGARDKQLVVTEAGARALECAVPLWEEAQREFRRRLGEDKVEEFFELLDRLEQSKEV